VSPALPAAVLAHAEASDSTGTDWVAPLLGALLGYLGLAVRGRRRGWQPWRLASFLLGTMLIGWALSPAFDTAADEDFGVHMAQHLLLAMLAPTALVLGAPVTVALRGLPPAPARLLVRALRSPPAQALAHPVTALVLSSGGLVALYFTPLYAATTTNQSLHALVHLHLAASGYLFAWAIAGPDPAPRRPTVRTRLIILGAAVAVHASVAQLLFAGLLVQVREPVTQMQAAGNLMYFGGDVAELLLAVALLATWRPRRPVRPMAASGVAPPASAFIGSLASRSPGRSAGPAGTPVGSELGGPGS
jgi:putative membrane protein